ncbi:uncharacterized protein HaLaN_10749 [Haematococcus lacustris]|uniref:Uncharacterized protein n=1 Tax=Haematococcus lacustris TaxID=44745 RepID=A0A699YYC5_HAELA|nr:uncharacterized protein HaLaN_10749 [Haematococcus lacustris]
MLAWVAESERRSIGVTELRTKAREYALKAIDAQRNQFKSCCCLRACLFDCLPPPHKYHRTNCLMPGYEAAQLSVFGRMFLNGHIYRSASLLGKDRATGQHTGSDTA